MAFTQKHDDILGLIGYCVRNKDADLALVETTLKETGERVVILCGVFLDKDGEGAELHPYAKLFSGNPTDELVTPDGTTHMDPGYARH